MVHLLQPYSRTLARFLPPPKPHRSHLGLVVSHGLEEILSEELGFFVTIVFPCFLLHLLQLEGSFHQEIVEQQIYQVI